MIAPQSVAISTRSSLASLPAMLAAARVMGVREQVADVTLPIAVALFRATGPAMNTAVAFYVAHWLGYEPTMAQMIAATAVGAVMSYGAVSLPGEVSFISSIAPDRHGAGRADRAARLAGRGRDGAGHFPHPRQRHAGRRGDHGGRPQRRSGGRSQRRTSRSSNRRPTNGLRRLGRPVAERGATLVEARATQSGCSPNRTLRRGVPTPLDFPDQAAVSQKRSETMKLLIVDRSLRRLGRSRAADGDSGSDERDCRAGGLGRRCSGNHAARLSASSSFQCEAPGGRPLPRPAAGRKRV